MLSVLPHLVSLVGHADVISTRWFVFKQKHVSRASSSSACVKDLIEAQLAAMQQEIRDLQQRLSVLERVAPAEFSVFHYNVLADQYASNLQPWFLYGADPPVNDVERAALTELFYKRDVSGKYVNDGWPRWAPDELLSCGRRACIEAYNDEAFAWDVRRDRLWSEVEGADADVLTLSECDHYDDFWKGACAPQHIYVSLIHYAFTSFALLSWLCTSVSFALVARLAVLVVFVVQ